MNVLYCLLSYLFIASRYVLNKFINCFNDIMLQLPTSWTLINSWNKEKQNSNSKRQKKLNIRTTKISPQMPLEGKNKIKGGPVYNAPTKCSLGSVDVCNLSPASKEAVSKIWTHDLQVARQEYFIVQSLAINKNEWIINNNHNNQQLKYTAMSLKHSDVIRKRQETYYITSKH